MSSHLHFEVTSLTLLKEVHESMVQKLPRVVHFNVRQERCPELSSFEGKVAESPGCPTSQTDVSLFIVIALGGWFSGGHSCPAPFHLHRLSCPLLSSLMRVMGTEPQELQETRLESRSMGTEHQCNPFQMNT